MINVKREDIVLDPTFAKWSSRMDEGFAENIKDEGIKEPVLVWRKPTGECVLVDGFRRYEAAKLANLPEIPCNEVSFADESAAIVWRLLNKGSADNVKPYVRALAAYEWRYRYVPGAKARQTGKAPNSDEIHVDKKLSQLFHVGAATIGRVIRIAKKAPAEFGQHRDDILAVRTTINKLYIKLCPPEALSAKRPVLSIEQLSDRADGIVTAITKLQDFVFSEKPGHLEVQAVLFKLDDAKRGIAVIEEHMLKAEKSAAEKKPGAKTKKRAASTSSVELPDSVPAEEPKVASAMPTDDEFGKTTEDDRLGEVVTIRAKKTAHTAMAG